MTRTESDNPLSTLMPTSPLMQPPWCAALRATLANDELMAHFRADTGNHWTPGRTPIDRMIDEATGADLDFLLTFVRWFNRWVWGEIDGRGCNGDEPISELWKPDEVTQ